MIDAGKRTVLGVGIDAVDYEAAVARIITAAKERQPLTVSALAVHGVMTGALDPVHRFRLNALDLVVPDGQPVRWALRWLHGVKLPQRVYGPNLMLKICEQAAQEQTPIYLYGSKMQTLAALQANLLAKFPKLPIAGVSPSRFRRVSAAERDGVVKQIQRSGAQIVFVGLGCPRQEVWAYEYRQHLSLPLVAVGAAFDFHAGLLPQAPQALQDRGLEWLYRMIQEPRRLWKRYLLLNPAYLGLLSLQALGIYRINPSASGPPAEELLYG